MTTPHPPSYYSSVHYPADNPVSLLKRKLYVKLTGFGLAHTIDLRLVAVNCCVCMKSAKKGEVLCSHYSPIANSRCAGLAALTCDPLETAYFAKRGNSPAEFFARLPNHHPASVSSSRGNLERDRANSPTSSSPHPPVAYKLLLLFKRKRTSITPDPTQSKLNGLTRCCSVAQSGQRDTGGYHGSLDHATALSHAQKQRSPKWPTPSPTPIHPPLSLARSDAHKPTTAPHMCHCIFPVYKTDAWARSASYSSLRVVRRAVQSRRARGAARGRGCRVIAPYSARRAHHVWRIDPVFLRGRARKTGRRGTGAQLVRLARGGTDLH